jgi:hypothetical protein
LRGGCSRLYETIDCVAVLFGYAISGERTLEVFYKALLHWAELITGTLRMQEQALTLNPLALFSRSGPASFPWTIVQRESFLPRGASPIQQQGSIPCTESKRGENAFWAGGIPRKTPLRESGSRSSPG